VDINLLANCSQPIPYVQYTDAVATPAFGRRSAWWILSRLAQAIGVPSPLDQDPTQSEGVDIINSLLAAKGLSIDTMRNAPMQTVTFPRDEPESLFARCLQHPDKKVDCCPPAFAAKGLFERCEAIFAELEAEPADLLKMISLRTPYINNTWMQNVEKFRRGKHAINPLYLCEHDARRHSLHHGDAVRISTQYGAIDAEVFISEDVRTGTVAMSHGFGQAKSFGLGIASNKPGSNCNAVMPVGEGTYEPMSYMSWISGIPVSVEKI
jgi:anaerobic selenocysteine-containing dehydrogenase